jgi:hypothetical protein
VRHSERHGGENTGLDVELVRRPILPALRGDVRMTRDA